MYNPHYSYEAEQRYQPHSSRSSIYSAHSVRSLSSTETLQDFYNTSAPRYSSASHSRSPSHSRVRSSTSSGTLGGHQHHRSRSDDDHGDHGYHHSENSSEYEYEHPATAGLRHANTYPQTFQTQQPPVPIGYYVPHHGATYPSAVPVPVPVSHTTSDTISTITTGPSTPSTPQTPLTLQLPPHQAPKIAVYPPTPSPGAADVGEDYYGYGDYPGRYEYGYEYACQEAMYEGACQQVQVGTGQTRGGEWEGGGVYPGLMYGERVPFTRYR